MNFENFLLTLPVMAKGMLGIFIVALVIIGFVVLLGRLSGKKVNK